MNKKIKFYFLIGAIVTIILSCGIVVVALNTSDEPPATITNQNNLPETIITRTDPDPQKEIMIASLSVDSSKSEAYRIKETATTLKYYRSDLYDAAKPIDIYTDAHGNEFRYNQNGRLLNYVNLNRDQPDALTKSISKDIAARLGSAQVKAAYGSIAESFILASCEIPTGGSFPGQYEVKFKKTAGEGGFIHVNGATVHISLDGTILGFSLSSSPALEAFDVQTVANISKATLIDWASNYCAKDFSKCSLSDLGYSFDLAYKNDEYYIRIFVSCFNTEHGYLTQEYLYKI